MKKFSLLFFCLNVLVLSSINAQVGSKATSQAMPGVNIEIPQSMDSIVKADISEWLERVEVSLATGSLDFKIISSNRIFMCNNFDDAIEVRLAGGQRKKLLPQIKMNFVSMSGHSKTKTMQVSIRQFCRAIQKMQFNIHHVSVKNVQVWFVDDAVKYEGRDNLGEYAYLEEHVCSQAKYVIDNGTYQREVSVPEDFYIIRGKSHSSVSRDECALIKENGMAEIIGDVELCVYIK